MTGGTSNGQSDTGDYHFAPVAGLVDSIIADIGSKQLDPLSMTNVETAWFQTRAKPDQYGLLRDTLAEFGRNARNWQIALSTAAASIESVISSSTSAELSPGNWLDLTTDTLQSLFQNDPDLAMNKWLSACASAIAVWRIEDWLVSLCLSPFEFPDSAEDVVNIVKVGTRYLLHSHYARAVEMLSVLVNDGEMTRNWHAALDGETHLRLLLLIGRIHLYTLEDSNSKTEEIDYSNQDDSGPKDSFEKAHEHFKQASTLAPNDGRPLAALAELSRVRDADHGSALSLNASAMERSPYHIDGYLGSGLLCEQSGDWLLAGVWYDHALSLILNRRLASAEHVAEQLDRLLLPISAHVFLRFAQMAKDKKPDLALTLVDRAIGDARFRADFFRIGHDGSTTLRHAYQLKGEIYDSLARLEDDDVDPYYAENAAIAFHEAGWRYVYADDLKLGRELLERAIDLDNSLAEAYWDLADALRFASYPGAHADVQPGKPPDPINYQMLEESCTIWHQGASLRLPDRDASSAYVVRALINDALAGDPERAGERSTLWWEAVVFAWRALLLDFEEAIRWAQLSGFFENLGKSALAIWASSYALQVNSENEFALEVQARTLANMGELERAEQVLKRFPAESLRTGIKSTEATILLRTGKLNEAIALASETLTDNPEDIFWLSVRSAAYQLQRDIPAAEQDDDKLWSLYDETDSANATTFAWTAFALRKFTEAIEIFGRVLRDSESETQSAMMGIGLSQLGLGELEQGERTIEQALKASENLGQINDVLLFDITLARRMLASQMEDVAPILARVEILAKSLASTFENTLDPESELLEMLKSVDNDTDPAIRIGVRCTLTWLYLQADKWEEATNSYQRLMADQATEQRLPEAKEGLPVALLTLSQPHLLDGAIAQALDGLRRALPLSPPDEFRIGLHLSIGDLEWHEGRLTKAFEHFAKAETLKLDPLNDSEEDWRSHMLRFTSELDAPVPDHWIARESITISHPDGKANVIVSVDPIEESSDSEDYATEQGEILRNEFPGYEELEFQPVEWLDGRQAYRRRFTWEPPDGQPVTQIQLYFAEDGRAYIATATTTSDDFEDMKHEMQLVLSGLLLKD